VVLERLCGDFQRWHCAISGEKDFGYIMPKRRDDVSIAFLG